MKDLKERIIREIVEIQKEFWNNYDIPLIKDVYIKDDVLTIIAYDRTDKSFIIGKGYIVGKLKERLKDYGIKKIRILSYNDLLIKKLRIKQTIKAIDIKMKMFNDSLRKFLKEFKEVLVHYLKTNEIIPLRNKYKAVVALSGGVDSSCSVLIAKKLNLDVTAVTVNPGNFILTRFMKENVERVVKKLNVNHVYINEDLSDIYKDALMGKFHPCSKCSKRIKNKLIEYCEKNNINIIIFGDNISTGSQAISYINENLLRLNLPASFCLTKREIKELVKDFNLNKYPYGCVMHMECLKRNPQHVYYTIQRIMREVRAGVQEPSDAARNVIEIFKAIYKYNMKKKSDLKF